MVIDPASLATPALRLAGTIDAAAPAHSAVKASTVHAPVDSYAFEAVYTHALPRVPLTAAHARLEQIRETLVAGKTAVPVHFIDAKIDRISQPYMPSYLRFVPSPADANANAVEQRVG